jgi:hypothetical protein
MDRPHQDSDAQWDKYRFRKTCLALQRNDPTLTHIEKHVEDWDNPHYNYWAACDSNLTFNSICRTQGFGRRLGEALVGNTHLTSLCIDLGNFFTSHTESQAEASLMLHYLRHTQTLRTLELQGGFEPHTSRQTQFIALAMVALANNQYIDRLALSGCAIPVDALADLLQSTRSLTCME